jgi:hypothetical protein
MLSEVRGVNWPFGEGAQKHAPVIVVFKDGLVAVATAHDVIEGAREFDARLSGHVTSDSERWLNCQELLTDPL